MAGKVVWRREVRRAQLMRAMAQLEPCLIGIEACGGANYWARRFAEFGHQVKMMSPQFVKSPDFCARIQLSVRESNRSSGSTPPLNIWS